MAKRNKIKQNVWGWERTCIHNQDSEIKGLRDANNISTVEAKVLILFVFLVPMVDALIFRKLVKKDCLLSCYLYLWFVLKMHVWLPHKNAFTQKIRKVPIYRSAIKRKN